MPRARRRHRQTIAMVRTWASALRECSSVSILSDVTLCVNAVRKWRVPNAAAAAKRPSPSAGREHPDAEGPSAPDPSPPNEPPDASTIMDDQEADGQRQAGAAAESASSASALLDSLASLSEAELMAIVEEAESTTIDGTYERQPYTHSSRRLDDGGGGVRVRSQSLPQRVQQQIQDIPEGILLSAICAVSARRCAPHLADTTHSGRGRQRRREVLALFRCVQGAVPHQWRWWRAGADSGGKRMHLAQ